MEKPATKQPFFNQLLEKQEGQQGEGRKGKEKGAGKPDEKEALPHTLKYPSDSDEGL